MAIEALRRPRGEDVSALVTRGVFTFVAIDDRGRPRPVREDAAG
jgi:acyl-CoA thioesterase YciA